MILRPHHRQQVPADGLPVQGRAGEAGKGQDGLLHQQLHAADGREAPVPGRRQQGRLPVWHLMGNETDCMIGNPGAIVLADLTLKGFAKGHEKEVFEALKTTQSTDIRSLDILKKYGYIPWDKVPTNETVANALEYCCRPHRQDRSQGGKRARPPVLLQPLTIVRQILRPRYGIYARYRHRRKFRTPFNPFNAEHRANDYTEGNAWQYTFLVPHDVHGLIKLFGRTASS